MSAAADADGDFVVAWLDDNVVAQRFGDPGSLTCTSLPKDDCRRQTKSGRGVFRFRAPSNPKRKTLAWRAPTLEATAFEEFGDPFTGTDYVLCVYDDSAADQPIVTAAMPAGDICNVVPCWTELSPPGKAIRYLDSLGTPEGVKLMLLRAGDEGRARMGLRGRGENLTLPPGALTPPVIVQLQASSGLCFTARYDTYIRNNDAGLFRAKPDPPPPTTTTTTTTTVTTVMTTSTTILVPPVCGNLTLEAGEECDDGNVADADGCSSVCLCNPATTPAVCNLTGDWEIAGSGGGTLTIVEDAAGNSTLSGVENGVPISGTLTRSDSCAMGTVTVGSESYQARATVADDCNSLTGVLPEWRAIFTAVRLP